MARAPYFDLVCVDEKGKRTVVITTKDFAVAGNLLATLAAKHPQRQYRIEPSWGEHKPDDSEESDDANGPADDRPTPPPG